MFQPLYKLDADFGCYLAGSVQLVFLFFFTEKLLPAAGENDADESVEAPNHDLYPLTLGI